MPLTTVACTELARMVMGDSPTLYNNANARIGVGDSSTAFSAGQTDLQGSNKFRKGMEASYPQRSSNELTFRSLYATDEANFHWREWGLFNDASAGTMLNRKVSDQGEKTSSEAWQFTVTVQVNPGS